MIQSLRPASRVLGFSSTLLAILQSRVRQLKAAVRTIVKHPLFKLAIIGFSIRLLLAPLTQFTYDPVVWYSAGNDMLAGLSPYYTKTYSYPPLWAYTYFPFLLIASLLVDPRSFATHVPQMDWISLAVGYSPTILSPVFLLTIKLPLIIGDLATGFLIFKLVKGYSGFASARKAYIFWLFNPFVIWTSAVHGAFDVLPAMFTLLSLALLLRSKYLQSGLSISIATLYKLYPVYLLPLYAVLVLTDLGKERSLRVNSSRALRRFSIFLFGGLIPLLASIPFISIPDMLHTVFARQTYLASLGGLSPWMLNYAPGFGWMWGLASNNLLTIALTSSLFAVAVSALAGWLLVRKGPVDMLGLLKTHVLAIAATFLTLVTVNPQYIIWILPFLTLAMFTGGIYKKRGILLGALALLWQLTISGPLVLLPMTYLGLPAELLTAPVQSVLISFKESFNPVLLVSGFAGGAILVSFLARREWLFAVHSLIAPGVQSYHRITFSDLRKSARAAPAFLLVAFILTMSLSSILVQTSSVARFLPTHIDSTLSGNALTTSESFVVSTGNFPLQLSLVAAPIASLGKDRPVFIYYDPRFPALGNDERGWIGILDHLPAELRLRGYSGQMHTVNATGLRNVMTQNITSVLVVPSGVFPSNVQNATGGLVGNWLRSGGTLVWMGGPFGFYSEPGPILNPATTNTSIAIASQTDIVGYPLTLALVNGTSRIASVSTMFSSALNLTYSDVWASPTLRLLRSVGGLAVGHLQNSSDTSHSSISIVPVGKGRIILFGGSVSNLLTADGEDVISHDAAQILSLGDLDLSLGIRHSSLSLRAGVSVSMTFTASFNVTTSSIRGVALAAFSDYSFSRLYWRTEVSRP